MKITKSDYMAQLERAKFGSKLGVILATAGSAVGLGNVWRFPYLAGENGGAAFMLLYIACVLALGMPCMIAEFIVGRRAQANAARAFRTVGGRTPLGWVGYLGVLTGTLITGYYAVVSGWCLEYIYASAAGHFADSDPAQASRYFAEFEQAAVRPIVWMVLVLLATHWVIVHGVRDGIERASKLMMPALFVLLLVIVVASCCLPGAWGGVEFLFKPDFSKVDGGVFLDALGQAFFSLSIGMGCMCTYASYFGRQTKLAGSAMQIGVIVILVAVLSGLMIFPAAFSVGIKPDSGPSLIFITLPNVFREAFTFAPALGYVVAILFYVLLTLAALTSLISLHEVSTAFLHEELRISRGRAAAAVTALGVVVGSLCSLSLGDRQWLQPFGRTLFEWCDFVTGQVLMPFGGFVICLFVGWYLPHKLVRDEYTNYGTLRDRSFRTFVFALKYVCPICIAMIFLNQLGLI